MLVRDIVSYNSLGIDAVFYGCRLCIDVEGDEGSADLNVIDTEALFFQEQFTALDVLLSSSLKSSDVKHRLEHICACICWLDDRAPGIRLYFTVNKKVYNSLQEGFFEVLIGSASTEAEIKALALEYKHEMEDENEENHYPRL